ncbi:MAG TPA: cell division protein ZapE [Hyphomicrobium sp.]|uniref:cell division protein ZapE n=1 Tax=Hyphomicrobium sp. TaxID=82 RepID=UPI002C180641|nr:cell division protein ZapE [Hyphomicrobium sp.]HXE02277.1 cell division protein ZapE [Hyphomicrobium sp.]
MGTIIEGYQERLAELEIEPDAAQSALAARLDALQSELMQLRRKRNVVSRILGKRPPSPRGLYIWGAVGRGKTMLMDLFFEETPFEPKRRAHFHEFMADVHDRIAMARTNVPGDPIPHVAQAIAKEARLLCFDELHVTDIADAMILGRLFEGLFAAGIVVVVTSNSPPSGLYKNGLNRQLFLPFIGLVSAHMDIVELKAEKDFRLDKLSGAQLYFFPADAAAKASLDKHWERLTGRHPGKSQALDVKGRKVRVPLASMGVARFHFDDLCAQPLGANDYLHIAHAFHTVIIDDIPLLTPGRRDVVRRFINLVDALYDNRICLIASTAAEPSALYPKGVGSDHFQRTASRLTEMRSEAYLAGHSGGRARR